MTVKTPIITEIKDKVYIITINRPDKLNSITEKMLDLISKALDEVNSNRDVKCVLITSSGDRAFSSGADIKAFLKMDYKGARIFSKKGQSTFRKILEVPKPVVAAINGYALGGGCELTQFCDIRIASKRAIFCQPEVKLGLIPGWGGTYMLKKIVGETFAKEMILTGRRIEAQEALEIGLVSHVYATDEFENKVLKFIDALMDGSPLALAAIKKLVNLDRELENALAAESAEFANLWNYKDLKEGLIAFKEKRKPEFKGV